ISLDTVESQMNRVEAMFLSDPDLKKLMPEIVITRGAERRNLIELAHRVSDAGVLWSSFREIAVDAIRRAKDGDLTQLINFSPLSVLGGYWAGKNRVGVEDKRGRILHAEITATNVAILTRRSQFFSAWRDKDEASEWDRRKDGDKDGRKDV